MRLIRTKAVVLGLLLSGCAHAPQGVKIEYVEKPVIQMEQCIPAGSIPPRPSSLKAGTAPGDLEQALALSLAKVSEWIRYGNKADAVMQSCAQK